MTKLTRVATNMPQRPTKRSNCRTFVAIVSIGSVLTMVGVDLVACVSGDPGTLNTTSIDASVEAAVVDDGAVATSSDGGGLDLLDGAAGSCPATLPFVPDPLWSRSPRIQHGACEAGTLVTIYSIVPYASSYAQLRAQLAAIDSTCASCVFGSPDDLSIAPILLDGDGGVKLNEGSCYAVASGSVACGAAYQAQQDCAVAACASCDAGVMISCREHAREAGACPSPAAACANKVEAYKTQCAEALGWDGTIKKLCIE